MMGRERRRSVRVTCSECVEGVALTPGILFRGTMQDLSETGCYVRTLTLKRIDAGHVMELRFRLENVWCRTLARVVQMTPAVGMRMEFVEMNPLFRKAVRRFCEAQCFREAERSKEKASTIP
jgi:hypothetical protein